MPEDFMYTDYQSLKEKLISLADEKYAALQRKLIPGENNIIGVRVPQLRAIAKQIAKNGWRGFLKDAESGSMEEAMLWCFVIGYAKMELSERLKFIAAFVPEIKSWAVCDTVCSSLKFTSKNKETVFGFLKPYFKSGNEFYVRFAVIMLMDYFIDSEYLGKVFEILDSVKHEGYYAKMAVAWAVSMCFVKFPEKTYTFLASDSLDDFTYNKSLQKIIESYRVSTADKEKIRKMKRPRVKSPRQ